MHHRVAPLIDINDRRVRRFFIFENGRLFRHENGASVSFKSAEAAQKYCQRLSDPDLDTKAHFHFKPLAIN